MLAMPRTLSAAARGLFPAVLTLILAATPFASADETITFDETSFSPDTVTITQGESVIFEWEAGSHVVTSGESSDPADSPGELFEELLDEDNPVFSYPFNDPGTYFFFDAEDEDQVGTIVVEQFQVEISVVDSAFSPATLNIFLGDEILWDHDGFLSHTVTSGTGPLAADAGDLFDEALGSTNPSFTYIFEETGTYDYFCRIHALSGMDGIVRVQERFVRGDADGNGVIDISDAVNVIDFLFGDVFETTCRDALDATDNGSVTVADAVRILDYLFDPSPPDTTIPRPFPLPGADRTVDSLLCE